MGDDNRNLNGDSQENQTSAAPTGNAPAPAATAMCEVAESRPFDRTHAIRPVTELPVGSDMIPTLERHALLQPNGFQRLEQAASEVKAMLSDSTSDALLAIDGEDILVSKVPELPVVVQNYRKRQIQVNNSHRWYGGDIHVKPDPLQGVARLMAWRFPSEQEARLMCSHHIYPESSRPSTGVLVRTDAVTYWDSKLRWITLDGKRSKGFDCSDTYNVADVKICSIEEAQADTGQKTTTLETLLRFGWVPEGLKDPEAFRILANLVQDDLLVVLENPEGVSVEPTDKLRTKIEQGEDLKLGEIALSSDGTESDSARAPLTKEGADAVLDTLRMRDYTRADITPYNAMQFVDPNRGSWELWDDLEAGEMELVPLPFPVYARDPRLDVAEDGVVGIDFGTSSTVVVYLDDEDVIRPMRIGRGRLAEKIRPSDYENPTVMQFIDTAHFLEAYKNGRGRPQTAWEDLTVSRAAHDAWKESAQSENFSSFFGELKQWAGSPNRQARIRDSKGLQMNLPPYIALGPGELDPIELYAYYIGLYVNNMHTGKIHLEYMLSFPTTYPQDVRRRIIESFTRGLRRSLPQTVAADSDLMEDFSVVQGVAEPTAYAVCALQEYGIVPVGDERIPYGVFDFGGGTTDFDFGIWRRARKDKESGERNYNRVIEHFGGGGDPYLGGENLLEMLAYETFKDNRDALLEAQIPFAMPPHCRPFPGSEVLVQDSQEAHSNLRKLVEAIRPLWEVEPADVSGKGGKAKTNTGQESIRKLKLFNQDGADVEGFELHLDTAKLADLIREKIEDGVDQFFDALMNAFTGKARDNHIKGPVRIFLAGNASKSPIVAEVFQEKMAACSEKLDMLFGKAAVAEETANDSTEKESEQFHLYYPLGTPQSAADLLELGRIGDAHDLEIPTGKTGVAFGLLQCREGSKIKVVSESQQAVEIPFQYWVGDDDDGDLRVVLSPSSSYGQWVEFMDAESGRFEIRFTSNSSAGQGMSVSATKRARQRIPNDAIRKGWAIFIRPAGPHEIEYVVAENAEAAQARSYKTPVERIVLAD